MAPALRLAVFSDDAYARVGDAVQGEMAVTLFLAAFAEHVQRLVIVGRLDDAPDRGRFALPAGVDFASLPYGADLTRPLAVARTAIPALTRFWRVLDDVDTVWLLGPSPLGLLFAVLARLRGRAVALGVRMSYPDYVRHRHPERRWLHWAARALDAAWRGLARSVPTVVVGADLAARYRRAQRLLSTPVSLVAAADVLEDDQARRRSYEGELRLLAVGRIDAEKNPLLLADVLAGLRADDRRWRLVVCGDGPLRGELTARLQALGLASNGELRGHVAVDELREAYRSSHAFLHVSWTEGVPQVLFEAFAAGLPVVATDVGGVREAAGPEAALLIPPGDPQAAVAALRRIAGDQALRSEMVEHGLEIARRHTREAQSRRVVEFLAARGHTPKRVGD
jgi:glycosyltransferase involved in cell wall biosynthesis